MVKKVSYEVLKKEDGVEYRRYPELLLASVYGLDDNSAFRILFDYISGANSQKKRIAMTAPVVSSQDGEPDCESCVMSSSGFFTFVMPGRFGKDDLPRPTDRRIDIHVQPPKTFAVVRFSGRAREDAVREAAGELMDKLGSADITTTGEPFLMRYNSPITPGFLRTNEVGVEVVGGTGR